MSHAALIGNPADETLDYKKDITRPCCASRGQRIVLVQQRLVFGASDAACGVPCADAVDQIIPHVLIDPDCVEFAAVEFELTQRIGDIGCVHISVQFGEHGHALRLHKQSDAKVRRHEITQADRSREPDASNPSPSYIIGRGPLVLVVC